MATTATRKTRGTRGGRRYPHTCMVPRYRTVRHPPKGQISESLIHEGGASLVQDGTRTVRYAIEWDTEVLREMVKRAAGNVQRYSKNGPITVYIHPDD